MEVELRAITVTLVGGGGTTGRGGEGGGERGRERGREREREQIEWEE